MAAINKVVNNDGEKEDFDERKLYASIFAPARQTGYGIDEAEELADGVVDEVLAWAEDQEDNVFTADEIRDRVERILQKEDEDVAFMYAKFEEMMR